MGTVSTVGTDGESWLDPRPRAAGHALAARPRPGTRRKLVLFDNSKMSAPYERGRPIRDAMHEVLQRMGSVTIEYSDLLIEPAADNAARVARWVADGVDGVVFGYCDAGVTQPTLTHAAAAEKAGIPTVVLCNDQVIDLAATCAGFLAPGLPLVCLEASRLAAPQELHDAAVAAADAVRQALEADPKVLLAEALARFPYTASLARSGADGAKEPAAPRREPFAEFALANRMTDGLPVVTPTAPRVAAMLKAVGAAGNDDRVLVPLLAPSGAPLTLRQAAISAVMAGCTPPRFPLVLAAIEAMSDPAYRLILANITTHPSGNLIVFSGPAAKAAGVSSGRGCMGPGNEANLTIGRAITLAFINAARAIPGLSVLSPFGSPAQLSICFADTAGGPFEDLATQLAGPGESVVWVHKVESPHCVADHISSKPEPLLDTIASVAVTLGGNSAYMPSDLLVVLNPEHADIFKRAGWTRRDVQHYLWQHARVPRARITGRGVKPEHPAEWSSWDMLPVALAPERIWIIVAGVGGPQSMVTVPWGYAHAVWRKIPAG